MSCRIVASAAEGMCHHLAAEYPREGCGLLVGRDLGGERRIEQAVPARNGEPDRRRYAIAPEDFLAIDKEARARGLEVVGFYHSHPDVDSTPSESDVAESWSHYTYLIVSMRAGHPASMAAWRFDSGTFVAEALQIVGASEVA